MRDALGGSSAGSLCDNVLLCEITDTAGSRDIPTGSVVIFLVR